MTEVTARDALLPQKSASHFAVFTQARGTHLKTQFHCRRPLCLSWSQFYGIHWQKTLMKETYWRRATGKKIKIVAPDYEEAAIKDTWWVNFVLIKNEQCNRCKIIEKELQMIWFLAFFLSQHKPLLRGTLFESRSLRLLIYDNHWHLPYT